VAQHYGKRGHPKNAMQLVCLFSMAGWKSIFQNYLNAAKATHINI